jgi:RHS repeat-associated protein
VLKQTETDLETGEQANITYIIGRNRIAQITVKDNTEQELYFTFDGHGSTRVLTDFAGAILELYAFDAYGNAISFDPSVALTEFLYSGEQFDSKIGQQYLRQRYYDPTTGRFNRLDPFFGNLNDPLSLHKYQYTHADPMNGIDPSGLFTMALGIGGFMSVAGVHVTRTNYDKTVISTGTSATTALATKLIEYGFLLSGIYFAVGLGSTWLGQPHAGDKTDAEYNKRMKYISNMNDLSRQICDAYVSGGLSTVKEKLKFWEIEISGNFIEYQYVAFPYHHWDIIRETQILGTKYYNRLGDGQVYVKKYLDYLGAAGQNWPMYSGLALSTEMFWHDNPYITLAFYLHEVRHSIRPYFGHTLTNILGIFPGVTGESDYSYREVENFLKQTKDNSGRSIHSYISEKAENDSNIE